MANETLERGEEIQAAIDMLRAAGYLVRGPTELWFAAGPAGSSAKGLLIMYGARNIGEILPPMDPYTTAAGEARSGRPTWYVCAWQLDNPNAVLLSHGHAAFATEAEAREAIAAALEASHGHD
jgi:hypothetical protein